MLIKYITNIVPKTYNVNKIIVLQLLIINILLAIICSVFINYFKVNLINVNDIENINYEVIFGFILGAPIIEEFIFRYPLILKIGIKDKTISFLTVITFFILIFLNKQITPEYYKGFTHFFIILFTIFIIYFNKDVFFTKELHISNQVYYFHFLNLMFGVFHLLNFSNLKDIAYLTPILILPQLFLSYVCSYIFLSTKDIKFPILYHAVYNFCLLSLSYF